MKHQHLAVGVRAGTDADHRDGERGGDFAGEAGGNAFKHEAETAGDFHGTGLAKEIFAGGLGATLDFIAAHGVDRLGGEAEVAHHRHTGADEVAEHFLVAVHTLDFHGMRAGPHEEGGAFDGGSDALARGEKGEVGDQQLLRVASAESAGHGGGVARHDFGRGGEGRRFAIEHDGEAVAHKHAIDGRGPEKARLPMRVGRNHRDGGFPFAGFEIENGLHANDDFRRFAEETPLQVTEPSGAGPRVAPAGG